MKKTIEAPGAALREAASIGCIMTEILFGLQAVYCKVMVNILLSCRIMNRHCEQLVNSWRLARPDRAGLPDAGLSETWVPGPGIAMRPVPPRRTDRVPHRLLPAKTRLRNDAGSDNANGMGVAAPLRMALEAVMDLPGSKRSKRVLS